jgi:DNA-binding response OmpR family regulator
VVVWQKRSVQGTSKREERRAEVQRYRILCVEDDQDMAALLTRILEREGYEVIVAATGYAGIEAVSGERPDLVLLDLMLPGVDGWEVYRHMKAEPTLESIPVIAVTAKSSSIDRVMGLRIAEVDDYITKPFQRDDLLRRVRRVLVGADPAAS